MSASSRQDYILLSSGLGFAARPIARVRVGLITAFLEGLSGGVCPVGLSQLIIPSAKFLVFLIQQVYPALMLNF